VPVGNYQNLRSRVCEARCWASSDPLVSQKNNHTPLDVWSMSSEIRIWHPAGREPNPQPLYRGGVDLAHPAFADTEFASDLRHAQPMSVVADDHPPFPGRQSLDRLNEVSRSFP
jgi:hypothetical protein